MQQMRKLVAAALAMNFNALLGIEPGHFGYTPRQSGPGAGVQRAAKRLAEHRAAQRARLANAPAAQETRQQIRSYAIRGR